MLISLEKDRMPSLQQIYLCCPPHFSVASLKEVRILPNLSPRFNNKITMTKNRVPKPSRGWRQPRAKNIV